MIPLYDSINERWEWWNPFTQILMKDITKVSILNEYAEITPRLWSVLLVMSWYKLRHLWV